MPTDFFLIVCAIICFIIAAIPNRTSVVQWQWFAFALLSLTLIN